MPELAIARVPAEVELAIGPVPAEVVRPTVPEVETIDLVLAVAARPIVPAAEPIARVVGALGNA